VGLWFLEGDFKWVVEAILDLKLNAIQANTLPN